MGGQQSLFFRSFFPKCSDVGIDLYNIELKECNNDENKFTYQIKDMSAEFILFYNHRTMEFIFCDTNDLPMPKIKRSIADYKLKSIAFKVTTDIDEFKHTTEEIIFDKTLCGWLRKLPDSNEFINVECYPIVESIS